MNQKREGGFLITLVNYQSKLIFTKILKKHGIELKHGEGRVLFTVWNNDGLSFGDVQKKTLIPKSTLAETLDRLEKADYIERITAETDRRKVLLRITDKTRGFKEALTKVSKDMTSLFYQGFDSDEIDVFEKYLKRILGNLS